ncbi:MAG: bifunctional phosphoribosylaminoimidazolecarboxamide formyltransferase/IMP cyclohydrolase [Phycisphaerae bacterium]|nr:bifunctional phosphoribosylaminoimidazolecarboxamide formyltransferase/IMP cyclohydrolase [Phycisphaerae bacterium]
MKVRRALLSVSNKGGIVEFASYLSSLGIELISTGGTAKALQEAGLEVQDVASLTGYPEMLDGRVKTLHPVVHGGLLGVRDKPAHLSAMEEHNILPIDLICIDLYPFEKTIELENVTDAQVIEQIDIGGPAMIRSAAKNFAFVTVITSPDQYAAVLSDLEENEGATSSELRCSLAKDAFTRTASYDSTIQRWMEGTTESFPSVLHRDDILDQTLRYGENPDQLAAVYTTRNFTEPSVVHADILSGKPLSYNNLMDADAALELVQDLHAATNKPAAAIIKHANPCGAAVSETLSEAFAKAWKCDPLAAFGGIVAVSGAIDAELSQTIAEGQKFLEVIVAPSFSQEAIDNLSSRWKNVRLLAVGNSDRKNRWQQLRSVKGGVLVQELSCVQADADSWEHVAGPPPTEQQVQDARVAWITCAHLKSNSISIVDQSALIGGGMGQVDRVSAARLAIQRASDSLREGTSPVAGSDAFFPFPDGPKLLIEAGVRCIVQPGGSVRDQETIDICEASNVTLLHTKERRFRH